VVFVIFACLLGLLGLAFLGSPPEEEPVTRVKLPAADPRLLPPQLSPQAAAQTLQTRIGQIAAEYPGTYGVVVFDASSGESVALNADRRFLAASLTKLPVLLTLYRAAALGVVDLDAEISILPSDVQAYGTGVLYRRPVGHTMTLRKCAEFMIKKSDNTAWVMLNRYLGRSSIEAELSHIGANSTAYWLPNTTTPNDILVVLKAIADPSYTSPELSAEMLDLMTNTSFEERLPRPLPEGTRVAHKIGSYGDTFSDAGIVFPEGRSSIDQEYYVVVFSQGAPENEARKTIQDISRAAYRALARSNA
jgi:beta-lactamase class A